MLYLIYQKRFGKKRKRRKEGVSIRKVSSLIRILCGAIDYIIVLIPVQFIMMGIFGVSGSQADLLYKLLFAVYGVLFIEYMNGSTPGKYIGKIKVQDNSGVKPTIMYAGLRELAKSLYLIPFAGWLLLLISVGMIVFGNGRALHDYIGGTRVVYAWVKEYGEDEDGVQ